MQILLCAATQLELQPTIDHIHQNGLAGKVDVLVTGVGLLAATYALTKKVLTARPALIIQAGVAGALNEQLPLGSLVYVGTEAVGDEGVYENGTFHSLFSLGLAAPNAHPWHQGRLPNPHLAQLAPAGTKIAAGVTVNEISTDQEQVIYYRDRLGADIESLEGAALHYVALKEAVPFLQVRSISNYIGERDKSKWVLREAIANLNTELQTILDKSFHL